MDASERSFTESCICGRDYSDLGALRQHKKSCGRGKKRLADALAVAKEVYHWKRACTTAVNLEQDPHHAGSSQPEAEATPQHATNVLPEPPLPLPPAGLNVPSEAHSPLRSSPSAPGDRPAMSPSQSGRGMSPSVQCQRIKTQQNKFGVFRIYDMETLPSHDPEDLSSILPPVLQNGTSPIPNDNNPFHPYPNENSLLLGNWYWNHGSQKSRETFKQLLEIVGSPNFRPEDVRDTRWFVINHQLVTGAARGLSDDPFGWNKTTVTISVPFHRRCRDPGPKDYSIPDFYHRSLLSII
ncbi:hypothetical protein BDN67DRAFT_911979, partial [Paxillus ammoniavirescens]